MPDPSLGSPGQPGGHRGGQGGPGPTSLKGAVASAHLVNRETPLSPLEEITIFDCVYSFNRSLLSIDDSTLFCIPEKKSLKWLFKELKEGEIICLASEYPLLWLRLDRRWKLSERPLRGQEPQSKRVLVWRVSLGFAVCAELRLRE